MTDTDFFAIDTFRTPVSVEGEDRQVFLQGLISNDTRRITETQAVYSAFLTPQGKFLHDFTLVEVGGRLFINMNDSGARARLNVIPKTVHRR